MNPSVTTRTINLGDGLTGPSAAEVGYSSGVAVQCNSDVSNVWLRESRLHFEFSSVVVGNNGVVTESNTNPPLDPIVCRTVHYVDSSVVPAEANLVLHMLAERQAPEDVMHVPLSSCDGACHHHVDRVVMPADLSGQYDPHDEAISHRGVFSSAQIAGVLGLPDSDGLAVWRTSAARPLNQIRVQYVGSSLLLKRLCTFTLPKRGLFLSSEMRSLLSDLPDMRRNFILKPAKCLSQPIRTYVLQSVTGNCVYPLRVFEDDLAGIDAVACDLYRVPVFGALACVFNYLGLYRRTSDDELTMVIGHLVVGPYAFNATTLARDTESETISVVSLTRGLLVCIITYARGGVDAEMAFTLGDAVAGFYVYVSRRSNAMNAIVVDAFSLAVCGFLRKPQGGRCQVIPADVLSLPIDAYGVLPPAEAYNDAVGCL